MDMYVWMLGVFILCICMCRRIYISVRVYLSMSLCIYKHMNFRPGIVYILGLDSLDLFCKEVFFLVQSSMQTGQCCFTKIRTSRSCFGSWFSTDGVYGGDGVWGVCACHSRKVRASWRYILPSLILWAFQVLVINGSFVASWNICT